MENLEQSHDVVEGVPSRIAGVMSDIGDRLSATSLGQFLLKKSNSALWVIEKCLEWSIPIPPGDLSSPGKLGACSDLTRPLPWIIFLPTIIVFRICRILLSLGAASIGKDPITPEVCVKFLQSRRRRIRAVRYCGLRLIRMRNQAIAEAVKLGLFERLKFSVNSLLCLDPQIDGKGIPINSRKSSLAKPTNVGEVNDKRKYKQIVSDEDEDDEEDEDVEKQLFEVLADDFSDSDNSDDPDFELPEAVLLEGVDDSSEEDSDEDENPLPESEKGGSHGSVTNQVITEENEMEFIKEEEPQKSEEDDIENHPLEPIIVKEFDMNEFEERELQPPSPSPPPLPVKKPVDTKTKVSPKIDSTNIIAAEQHSCDKSVILEVANKDPSPPSGDEQFYSPLSSKCTSPEPCDLLLEPVKQSEKLIDSEKTPTNENFFNFDVKEISATETIDSASKLSSSSSNVPQNSSNGTATDARPGAQIQNQHKEQNHHTKNQKKGHNKTPQKNHKHSPKLNHVNNK